MEGLNLMHYSGICLESLYINFSQENRLPRRGSMPGPPKHEAAMLIIRNFIPTERSIITFGNPEVVSRNYFTTIASSTTVSKMAAAFQKWRIRIN
jgi:hypothetical protein